MYFTLSTIEGDSLMGLSRGAHDVDRFTPTGVTLARFSVVVTSGLILCFDSPAIRASYYGTPAELTTVL